MAESDVDPLQLYWEHFFRAETGAYEKSTWLDLFLAEYIVRLSDGAAPEQLINFCPVSGVVSLVGCEVLCGVHRLTSALSHHAGTAATTQGNTELSEWSREKESRSSFSCAVSQPAGGVLRQHLLRGAWRPLLLLRTQGVQGLSCCRQLSSVLMWAFGEVGAGPPARAAVSPLPQQVADAPRTPIHQLFSRRIWTKPKYCSCRVKTNPTVSPDRRSASTRLRHGAQMRSDTETKTKRRQLKQEEPSSESAESNGELQQLSRTLTVKLSTPDDDFQYFNSPLRSSYETLDSDPSLAYRKFKPKPDDYLTERHKQIINAEISAFEFTLLVTDLLKELCRAESSLSGAEGSQVSVQCINFSLRNLCSLQFGSLPLGSLHYDASEVFRIKVALTELLMVSLDRVLINADLCSKLINNGILPMLLRLLEDVVCKSRTQYSKAEDHKRAKETEVPNKAQSEDLLKFLFGVAYSIMAFFNSLLMQCRGVDDLRDFTEQFKLYGECLKGDSLKECIEVMVRTPGVDREENITLVKKLIESIGKLVSGMKRVRSEVVHSAACPRTQHKACRARVFAGSHHHHELLGDPSPALPLAPACCVSTLCGNLTSLLTDEELTARLPLRNKLLRVMLNCGVCCCFSSALLMQNIVRLMLTHGSLSSRCLQLLERTVYGELGAGVLVPKVTDRLPCAVCEPADDRRDAGKKYCPHGTAPLERKSVWSFLIHYNSLLQLDNQNNVLHATVNHLLRVTPKCRTEMKHELLFSVIYPTFIVAKHRYSIRMEEAAYFLTVSCLNIFASLLTTVPFAEQFIQKGGLSYVLELVSLSEFSKQCCSILEIAIIVEIFKLTKQTSEQICSKEINSLASVQMLFESLSQTTNKCYKIYRLKLSAEKFNELCDLSKEKEALSRENLGSAESQSRKFSTPKTIRATYATSENVVEESIEDYLEILKSVLTFWKSCAALCLYSPAFRAAAVREPALLDSFVLLRLLLHQLSAPDCGIAEMRLVVSIIEALLTVQFTVSEATSGRSKETSCAAVRTALAELQSGGAGCASGDAEGEGRALRALCEALVRVATSAPSPHHSMPAVVHTKTVCLEYEGGDGESGSGRESSSSEESAAGPYASEHSDARLDRPDDGYEADVEACRPDTPTTSKPWKLSDATDTDMSPSGESVRVWCGEYGRGGELAHPELCLIVVDVLSQLIDKVVSGGLGGEVTVCAQVARACCVRLSRAAPRPPALLRRLLDSSAAALLAADHNHLQELQRSILELIETLAAQSISAGELVALLRVFGGPRPPLAALLPALHRLVCAAEQNTPDCILTFPVQEDTPDKMASVSEELSHLVLNNLSSQSHQAEQTARRLRDAHCAHGVVSAWSVCAMRCGVEGAGWAPWLQGFALMLWLRPAAPTPTHQQRRTTTDNHSESAESWQESGSERGTRKAAPRRADPTHVISLGHDSLLFELWLDVATGSFLCRLSRPESGVGNKTLSERRVPAALSPHRWSCVALNVREVVHKRRIHIQVTIYVNGCECETVSLPLQGLLVRKVTPTNVLVGHATRAGASGVGAYHACGASVYRAPVLTQYTALHLAAHPPDHSCQVRCECPNFPLLLDSNVLDSNIDWDQVYEMSGSRLRELHDNLLLTFSAHAPSIMNLYHQTVPATGVFSGRVTSSSGFLASSAGASSSGPASSIPETLFTTWTGAPLASRHQGLPSALYLLGGPPVLMYLFARVVEVSVSAQEQALALGILLRASRADGRLYAQLYGDASLDMLQTVFSSPLCKLSTHLLKTVLDEASSSSILSCSGSVVQVVARSDSVLLEPVLLVFLVKSWRHLDPPQVKWEMESGEGEKESGEGSLWALLLRCTRVWLRPDHPRHAFNHYQLSRVDLLRHLLTACKERFLNSECGPLEASASASLVELVRALLAEPPLLCHLAMLCDFLLLMHQASDTFVTHSRANFHFLLTPETPETSDFNLLNFMNKRKDSRRAKRKSRSGSSGSSLAVEDPGIEHTLIALKELNHNRDAPGDTMDTESSLDSTKQLKGFINAQIKEGRKHNRSSTSENSESTIGESGGAEETLHDEVTTRDGVTSRNGMSAQDDVTSQEGITTRDEVSVALSDYIVVEPGDVHHTTVEMYSSGILEQKVVRAGAGGCWAGEGLLLLLRDAIGTLPDQALHQAGMGAIQAESLLVLANHQSAEVRAAVVRVVAALQRRAPADLARRLRSHLYLHLANQISIYPGSWTLAEACAALLTKCDVPLEDQLDEEVWHEVSEECLCRGAPLLALLPASLRDVPLAHNLTLLVRKIIDKGTLKTLSELSVSEVVVKCVREVGVMDEFEGRQLLQNDLHELLAALANKALATTQHHAVQTITELHYMLTYVESSSGARAAARGAQVALYLAQLDRLEDRLHSALPTNKPANYFTTVLSSAVSLGSEGMSRSDLAARHFATVVRAVNFLVSQSPQLPLQAELPLFDRLLNTLLLGACGSGSRGKWWAGSGPEWASPLAELVWWTASPAAGARPLQPALLRALYQHPAAAQLLTPPDPQQQRKLAVYLLSMLQHIHGCAEQGSDECGSTNVELAITDWARGWAVGSQAALPDRVPAAALQHEGAALLRQDLQRWNRASENNRHKAAIAKVVFSKDALASRLTESAMSITRQVVDIQNSERKAFMEHLRRAQSEAVAAVQRWQRLVDTYTHEHALWHDPASYPQSWQLDPTEGPGRVRLRLRRAHLDIPPRFLKPEYRYKVESIDVGAPLHKVLGGSWALRGGLVARLQLNETVSHMARVTHVTVARDTPGELLLSDRCIHFVPEESEQESPKNKSVGSEYCGTTSWSLEAVVSVALRRWCLQEVAVELFLSSGHAQLVAFADTPERDAFLKALDNCHLPNRTEPETLTEAMTQWRNGAITNWEYLMKLNSLAGRTYNDLMQYPVLPFVLADYCSRVLDLADPAAFRDLSRPMAVQNRNREQHYINTYNDLKAAKRDGCSPLLSRQPHHYASLYSNSGGVLHYLVRVPPFTELFLNYQDNNFDMPDRTFHSLATTWRLITQDSPTDVKELIPELFYLPELFHNNEGLNLGVRQCGLGVDSVELPPWAADARLFTLAHRQALEATHVTDTLPHWIDLVFGYKQTGQAAIDALNVFPACTYYGFDPSALQDEVDRLAAAAMVRTYGQAPRQLLRQPHPHRAADLTPLAIVQAASLLGGVAGVSWGRYCGSPGLPPAEVVARRSCTPAGPAALHALPLSRAVAIAPRATALVALHGDMSSSSAAGGLALVSWGHSDGALRLKRRDARPDLLLHVPPTDQITAVASSCTWGACPVFLGHSSGRVQAVRVRVRAGALHVRTRSLHAHHAPLADVHVCPRAGLLVTASTDGRIVLWDLHKLSYIRTLPNREMLPVTLVTVSATLSDVASVHDPCAATPLTSANPTTTATPEHDDADPYENDASYKYKSLIRVHTVNGSFVGSVKVGDVVTCVCYSSAAEGVSVNCVAAGLRGGGVRLYCSWDLRPLAYIPPPDRAPAAPLLSIAYSSDCQVLFGWYGDGTGVAWESGADRPAPVRLLPAHQLF